MKKTTYKAKATVGSQAKKRSDKLCIRFNDGGCNAKSCFFVHKCVSCGDATHGNKECKSKKQTCMWLKVLSAEKLTNNPKYHLFEINKTY